MQHRESAHTPVGIFPIFYSGPKAKSSLREGLIVVDLVVL